MKKMFFLVIVLISMSMSAQAAEIPEEFKELFDCHQIGETVTLPSGNEVRVRDVEYCSYAEFVGVEDPEEKYPPYYVAIEVEYKNNTDKPIAGTEIADNCDLAVYAWPGFRWNGWLIWEEEFYNEYEEGYPLPMEMTVEYIFRMTDEYNDKRVLDGYNKWDELVSLDEVEVQPGESVVFMDLTNIVSPDEVIEAVYCLAYSISEDNYRQNIRVNCLDIPYSDEDAVINEVRLDDDAGMFNVIGFPEKGYWLCVERNREEVSKVIMEYQKQNNLPVNGDMDELTYAYLYKEYYLD